MGFIQSLLFLSACMSHSLVGGIFIYYCSAPYWSLLSGVQHTCHSNTLHQIRICMCECVCVCVYVIFIECLSIYPCVPLSLVKEIGFFVSVHVSLAQRHVSQGRISYEMSAWETFYLWISFHHHILFYVISSRSISFFLSFTVLWLWFIHDGRGCSRGDFMYCC